MLLNITIVSRQTSKVKTQLRSASWTMSIDMLSSVTSTFNIVEQVPDTGISIGDFVLVKFSGERWIPTSNVREAGGAYTDEFSVPYFGIVDSYESQVLTTRPLREIINTTGIVYSSSVEKILNPIMYMNNLVQRYVKRPGMMLDNFTLPEVDNSAYKDWSLTLEKPESENLLELATTMFKDMQMTYYIYSFSLASNGTITFHFGANYGFEGPTIMADDTKSFANISVYVRDANYGAVNAIRFQDATKAQGTYTDYYLQTDGTVVSSQTALVTKPISPMAYYWDTSNQSDPKPTMLDTAKSQLTTLEYQHEISFDVNMDEIDMEKFRYLGGMVKIIYKGQTYASIVSSIKFTSDSHWATVTCGNVRTNMQTVLGK